MSHQRLEASRFVWSEGGGAGAKPMVERQVQTAIRASVSPAPNAEVVRTPYRPSTV